MQRPDFMSAHVYQYWRFRAWCALQQQRQLRATFFYSFAEQELRVTI